jgi:GT2 family glycosyltransferase/glycosyltransferase involved in cell wall biosynthesis
MERQAFSSSHYRELTPMTSPKGTSPFQASKLIAVDNQASHDHWRYCLSTASFWRPDRLVESAWLEHAPFAFWLVDALRPRSLVELGTHRGFSYSAFCQAVDRLSVGTRCYAVDTWQGDEHSGFYGDEVFNEFRSYHDRRYDGFSRLLRMSFEEAVPYFADGSIDVLHIDGRHFYNDVRDDFSSWKAKLSDRAIVLFHDTNVLEQGFGVFKLWSELSGQYPSFEFIHGHGLGVLSFGKNIPSVIEHLFAYAEVVEQREAIRNAYAGLGSAVKASWSTISHLRALDDAKASILNREGEIRLRDEHIIESEGKRQTVEEQLAVAQHKEENLDTSLKNALHGLADARGRSEAASAVAEAAQKRLLDKSKVLEQVEAELSRKTQLLSNQARLNQDSERVRAETRQALEEAQRELSKHGTALREAYSELTRVRSEAAEQRYLVDLLRQSSSWRITAPLRSRPVQMIYRAVKWPFDRHLRNDIRTQPDLPLTTNGTLVAKQAPDPSLSASSSNESRQARAEGLRIVFLSGEPHTPGHNYRIEHYARAARALGAHVKTVTVHEVSEKNDALCGADLVFVWRAEWSEPVAAFYAAAREQGAKIIFDVDDLMFDPGLARRDVIDAIRTLGISEEEVSAFYGRILNTFAQSDYGSAPTSFLAHQMRRFQKPAFVLPNGFDHDTLRISRAAVRMRRISLADGIDRIGYAAGTRTHQKDFRLASASVARVLRERSNARLVLFSHEGSSIVDLSEFPELEPLHNQIEFREMVTLNELPNELARFDVNLAPLETSNPFCEAKSELKYFEAALVGVPTIASPTEVFRDAIQDEVTGVLANTPDDWYLAIESLLSDNLKREKMGRAALHNVLWKYGSEERVDRFGSMLDQVCRQGARAAKAFAMETTRVQREYKIPTVPPHTVLCETDTLDRAEVTVIIPLYNYAHYIIEALESVRSQSLEKLDLIVVDDMSTDDSASVARLWMETHAERFNRALLVQPLENSGLALSRNLGFTHAETPFVLPLDADNQLLPNCVERCLEVLRNSNAAFAYPHIRRFGLADDVMGEFEYDPVRFVSGNYIDAMALVRKAAWARVGGYDHIQGGWEDYDFWAKLAEQGLWGQSIPEILAKYRVHNQSMIQTQTNVLENKERVFAQLEGRHAWIRVHRCA